MLKRFAAVAVVGTLLPLGLATTAFADPAPAGNDGPPVDTGVVASDEPATVTTPDGWTLTVAAKDETELPVAPLTTAVSSREYLVGGTFTGTVTGKGKTTLAGGTLEAGYQIGCGVDMSTSQGVTLSGSVGVTPAIGVLGLDDGTGTVADGILPQLATPVVGGISPASTASGSSGPRCST